MPTTYCGLQLRPTRYAGLCYVQQDRTTWRFVSVHDCDSVATPAVVGPQYRTKAELLADMDRYAREYWGY